MAAHSRQDVAVGPAPRAHSYNHLLPGPAAVLDHLEHCRATADAATHALILLALPHREGWPLPPSTLTLVCAAVTRSIRAEDWIGRAGLSDLAVIIRGDTTAAATMAQRLVGIIGDLRLPGFTPRAAVTALDPGLHALAVLDAAGACLRTARATDGPPVAIT
jgi:hypothetical protein